jgi:polar amino acid transport system substrate-binding protein
VGRCSKLVVLTTGLCLVTACGIPRDPEGSLDRIRRSGVLRAGITPHEPFTTDAGGPEADIITAFAQTLGARVEWHRGPESRLFEALERFELDVAIGGFTMDNPWGPKLGFTRPYLEVNEKQHVVAAAPGENRLLVELERVLRTHAPTVAARVGGKPIS